jgi:hypothetical protein
LKSKNNSLYEAKTMFDVQKLRIKGLKDRLHSLRGYL